VHRRLNARVTESGYHGKRVNGQVLVLAGGQREVLTSRVQL
jgi:hypothetical protein